VTIVIEGGCKGVMVGASYDCAVPSIAVVVPAYNASRWIDETLRSVLEQTRPPDEIFVVNDGSTDDTSERARSHGDRVTVIDQSNGGPPAAYNRGFDSATTDYVAMCPADDVWLPQKLEWQEEVLAGNPSVDVLFARATFFGQVEGLHPHPAGEGILDRAAFMREMYHVDLIPAPTAVVRRDLHVRLGRFDESLPSEDYEFWMRSLRAGAVFYHDPRSMVNHRIHGGNVSLRAISIREMNLAIHRDYADDVGDPELSRRLIALDLREVARARFGLGRTRAARDAYVASLRRRPTGEALFGTAALSIPGLPHLLRIAARRLT
jgi:glycosyltransferase involved in cell wall biosynthesis